MNSRRLIFAPDAQCLIRWHKLLTLCDRAEEDDHAGSKERAPRAPATFPQPLIAADEISGKRKPAALGGALIQWLAPGVGTQVLGDIKVLI
jgi:hypothetical protein